MNGRTLCSNRPLEANVVSLSASKSRLVGLARVDTPFPPLYSTGLKNGHRILEEHQVLHAIYQFSLQKTRKISFPQFCSVLPHSAILCMTGNKKLDS
ncbi:hypothetical protein Scep_029615 [Stephania cephalantha]|uniref:Uncharacterized protein n=1 Tax=Stephania cephalantha TaxID=152367 RepID=A0AAP0HDN2_9MAGN